MPYLTAFVRTHGSPLVYYTLLSIKDQMRPMDELVVLADGKYPEARKIFLNTFGIRQNTAYLEVPQGDEEILRRLARGVWFFSVDEGDLLLPGALDHIRDWTQVQDANEHPLPVSFRSDSGAPLVVRCEAKTDTCNNTDLVVVLRQPFNMLV